MDLYNNQVSVCIFALLHINRLLYPQPYPYKNAKKNYYFKTIMAHLNLKVFREIFRQLYNAIDTEIE